MYHKIAETTAGGGIILQDTKNTEAQIQKADWMEAGVLIDRRHSVWRLGKRSRFLYAEMTEEAEKQYIRLFFFFARDVDWEKYRIKGRIWKQKRWYIRNFPIPAVIYNRIVERTWEKRLVNQQFASRIEAEKKVYMFNTRFLNKIEAAEALGSYPELQPYLPASAQGSAHNLDYFLQHYRDVFVKPADGCKGQGIIYIRKNKENIWQIKKAAEVSGKLSARSPEKVLQILKKWRLPLEQCILQQGIPRAVYQGNVFDIRALAQKNGAGVWNYIGAAPRLAVYGKEVTHRIHGGKKVSVQQILSQNPILQAHRKKILYELCWLCRMVPQCLEKQIPLHWGMLAFDLAVTPQGHWYLLEVNARPGSYDEKNIRLRSLRQLIAYMRYVAGRMRENENLLLDT